MYNHTLAKSLFRSVTEDQVFHYQNTVTPMVMNHADNRETIWRAFCRKVYNCMHQGVRGGGGIIGMICPVLIQPKSSASKWTDFSADLGDQIQKISLVNWQISAENA